MKAFKKLPRYMACVGILWVCQSCGHEHGPHTHTHDNDSHTHGEEERGDGHSHYDENRPAFTYLMMNGEFHLNPGDSLSQNDPRNPGRLILETSEEKGTLTKMTFFHHDNLEKKLAECGYQYIGSQPDPYYFPDQSKTSIWDVFEKTEDYSGDCSKFKYVISRSPHGDPLHMHLRYGDNAKQLLEMSLNEEDSEFNPWWATYCDINQTTSCD